MTLRAPMLLAVIAVLLCLSPLLFACSSERPEGQTGGGNGAAHDKQSGNANNEVAEGPSKGAGQTEPPPALVPITHLSSTLEGVTMKDLSKAPKWPSREERARRPAGSSEVRSSRASTRWGR